MNAEERVKRKFGEDAFNALPEPARRMLIDTEQRSIEAEMQLAEANKKLVKYERHERSIQRVRDHLGVGTSTKHNKERFKSQKMEIDKSCQFNNNENRPISYCNSQIMGFRKETILAMEDEVTDIIQRAADVQNVNRHYKAYMMFHIWKGKQRRAGTQVVPMFLGDFRESVDDLFEFFDDMINDIEKAKHGYEYIFEEGKSYVHLYIVVRYYPKPECIENWGLNIPDVIKCKSFSIFTANNPDIHCIIQVSRRLFNKDFDEVDDIVKELNNKVCILNLHDTVKRIKYIKDYSDFKIDPISPHKDLSVIDNDIKYLLIHNSHIGLLENIREQKRIIYHTKQRPLFKFNKDKKITVCFDIECYFDPRASQTHVPYLCCACFSYDEDIEDVVEFEDKDCVRQMLDWIVNSSIELKHRDIELVAHNGGAYDFHYIITALPDPSLIKRIMVRNNNFISFQFDYNGVKFTVKDSLNFMLCSLANAAKAFISDSLIGKTDFPHYAVKQKEDLQDVYQKWISIDENINVNTEKDRMFITSDHVINYDNDGESKKLIDWSKEYCKNDVIVLAKVWNVFKETVKDVFKCDVVDQTYTLAGMSFRLFEASLPKGVKLEHPTKDDFDNIRKSLIGGRCISVNGIHKNVLCLDVKSLYPAAMAYYDQPYDKMYRVWKESPNLLGIYYCKVKCTEFKVINGFFPIKINGKTNYSCEINEEFEAWYTSVDIMIGREEGYKIEAIPVDDTKFVGYVWKKKGKIFKDYIEGVLYRLKLEYEKAKKHEQRWIIKIIMNALWGKFAQKWINIDYKIKHDDDCDFSSEKCYKIFDTDFMLIKKKRDVEQGDKPVQNGVFTLSYARYHMYKIWKAMAKPNTDMFYSDTDSIMVKKEDIDMSAKIEINNKLVPAIGSEMGQLEIEHEFETLICVGKKQYIGSYRKNGKISYKKRFKGVPLKYITPELYSHLIKDPDNTAQIEFLKFSREWGCVQGKMERKIVKQT